MIKSTLVLLVSLGLAWSAWQAPGPPVMPAEFQIQSLTVARTGKNEPSWLSVRPGRDPRVTVSLTLQGLRPDEKGLSHGTVRTWIVGSGVPQPMPRRDFEFRGSSGSLRCNFQAPPGRDACHVVVTADDDRGGRESRSAILE